MTVLPIRLLDDAGYTALGVGRAYEVGTARELSLSLSVHDVSAGALAIAVETAASAKASTWRRLGAFAAFTAAGQATLSLTGAAHYVRATYALTVDDATASLELDGTASLTLLAYGPQAATGVSSPQRVGPYYGQRVRLEVGAVSAPLDVTLETSDDAAASVWRELDAFPQVTTAGVYDLLALGASTHLRVRWTGDATFGVKTLPIATYTARGRRASLGLSGGVSSAPNAVYDDALVVWSDYAAGLLRERYALPLLRWGADLERAILVGADWDLIANQGYEPDRDQNGQQIGYRVRYEDVWGKGGWFDRLIADEISPDIVDSSQPPPAGDGAGKSYLTHLSLPSRGYQRGR